jgi:hypothetical protein
VGSSGEGDGKLKGGAECTTEDKLRLPDRCVVGRRAFIANTLATVAVAALPSVPDSYWCDCWLVQYFRKPERHFAATHFDGKRFTYGLFMQHKELHRKMVRRQTGPQGPEPFE